MPDFRAEERTFQLVTQLAGRSGRDAPGRVVVQTLPARRASRSRFAARHDVDGFLARELERRRELGYPPFRHLVRVLATGRDRGRRRSALLEELRRGLRVDAELLGPAPLLRLRGRHRAQLVAKTERPRRSPRARRRAARPRPRPRCGRPGVTAVVDVDPQEL